VSTLSRGLGRGAGLVSILRRKLHGRVFRVREAARLGRDIVHILRGTDEIAPGPKDKRFADPAWALNPRYRRLAQA
jgi:hypothetical protein